VNHFFFGINNEELRYVVHLCYEAQLAVHRDWSDLSSRYEESSREDKQHNEDQLLN
jgi:hypothetical protein